MKFPTTDHHLMESIVRQAVDNICRTAKSANFQAETEQHIYNPKALFRITDLLTNKTKVTKLPKDNDPRTLPNDFVCFFSEKIRIMPESFSNIVVSMH